MDHIVREMFWRKSGLYSTYEQKCSDQRSISIYYLMATTPRLMWGPTWVICVHSLCTIYKRTTRVNNNVSGVWLILDSWKTSKGDKNDQRETKCLTWLNFENTHFTIFDNWKLFKEFGVEDVQIFLYEIKKLLSYRII